MNSLPEKVLQFGTGILLRGLPDYFIDNANRQNIFNGSILVVKSTAGSADDFEKHGNQYTLCIRGIEKGKTVEEDVKNTSISRVLTAQDQWPLILEAAANPGLQIIISNTTEVGIKFEAESVFQEPPVSFPGKLTGFLYERFKKLGTQSPPVVIIPTELLPDNGKVLYDIVLKLSAHNQLNDDFINWLAEKTIFCSSLVDRIVTRPSDAVKDSIRDSDALTIQAEPYRLWAIEGNHVVREILSFAASEPGIVISGNIYTFRERKLRLLNGTHTATAGLGFLLGFDTVYQCMQDTSMSTYISDTMLSEIEPTIPTSMHDENIRFANEVLDRFRNPYTVHRLLSITLQATAKMKMRNVPTFLRYAERFNATPLLLTRGFAGHLLFMKAVKKEGDSYFGVRKGEFYPITDDQAAYFYNVWQGVQSGGSLRNMVVQVAQNKDLWDTDLARLPKFVDIVISHLESMIRSAG